MSDGYKEVYFDQYCKTCQFKNIAEEDEICSYCLDNPVNLNSHKPVNYKPDNE